MKSDPPQALISDILDRWSTLKKLPAGGGELINLPPDETIACVRKKIELDLEYIDMWSLRLDFEILLRTIPAVLKGSGAA